MDLMNTTSLRSGIVAVPPAAEVRQVCGLWLRAGETGYLPDGMGVSWGLWAGVTFTESCRIKQ